MNRKTRTPQPPKRRNAVVQAMMARSAKAGRHTDRRKEARRRACRKPIKQEE